MFVRIWNLVEVLGVMAYIGNFCLPTCGGQV